MDVEQQIGTALLILGIGLAVLFIAVVALIVIVRKIAAEKTPAQPEKVHRIVVPQAVPVRAAVPAQPVVQEGIPGAVVAAIAGAVWAVYGQGASSIREIRREETAAAPVGRCAHPVRSAWAAAGLLESTRPF